VNSDLECKIRGKICYFTSEGQNPAEDKSVFDNAEDFVQDMHESTAPTMLKNGGSYLKGHEIHLDDAFFYSISSW
jgi:hypothetical protein